MTLNYQLLQAEFLKRQKELAKEDADKKKKERFERALKQRKQKIQWDLITGKIKV